MGNIYGGIVAAIIALPLAIAFGITSGLGAAAGIYGAIFLGFLAALFGGTKTQISGPTGPMTVVSASVIAQFSDNHALIFGVFFLAGVFQIALGLLRIGKLIRFIPYPVISGFMTGIGIIIIVLQINVAFGLPTDKSVLGTLGALPSTVMNMDIISLLLTLSTLLMLLLIPKSIDEKLPSPLTALILLSAAAHFLHLDVAYVSNIPRGLPHFTLPEFDTNTLFFMINSALTLALLGAIDSLLTSIVADSMSQDKHNSNKELIGQGIGNTVASLFGGLPGAGATMRTVINIKSGATQKSSGMIHAVFLLMTLFIFAPLAAKIPMPVLAGILIKVGIDILDYKMLKQINIIPKHDLLVMTLVFLLTIFVDLIIAVGAGVVLASFLIINQLVHKSHVDVRDYDGSPHSPDTPISGEDIRIVKINGPFFFGSISPIIKSIEKVCDFKNVIIDCSNVLLMDLSAIYALSDSIFKLNDRGGKTYIVADEKRRQQLLKFGIMDFVPQENILPSQKLAIENIQRNISLGVSPARSNL